MSHVDLANTGLNCHQIAMVEVSARGGTIMRGWALPTWASYHVSHTWVERDGAIIEHLGMTSHTSGEPVPYDHDAACNIENWLDDTYGTGRWA
jgi:hypothetical protein